MKTFLFLFLIHTCSNVSAQDLTETTGFVQSFNKKIFGTSEITVRTPREDLVLNFDKLDTDTQKRLSSEDAKKNRQVIKFNKSAVLKRKGTPMGVRADCTEMPVSMDEIEGIAKKSNNMVDFLNKIPEGSLQGFTFVTNSLSLHRGQKDANGEGQVSTMWPRVLRSSIDGKTTVSFVCDPKNPTFGKVEIIHFDDKEKEFQTTEIDFGSPQGKKIAPGDRVHKNPESCISCHAGSEVNGKVSIKPNWPEYFQWSDCKDDRGIQVYGGNDDSMQPGSYRKEYENKYKGCDAGDFLKRTHKEQEDYVKFRELQKNNACFNSLPWPDQSKDKNSMEAKNWSYKYYPYIESASKRGYDPEMPDYPNGIMNFSLRTNLRFTSTYSQLMAIRIGGILKKNPKYNVVKYFLAMAGGRCVISDAQRNTFTEIISNTKSDGISPITQFSRYVGLKNSDWTMDFQGPGTAEYASAIPGGDNDLMIEDVVGGEILKDISKTNPIFANAAKETLSRGTELAFGKKFSCIDDLGGAITTGDDSEQFGGGKLCELLSREAEKAFKNYKDNQAGCTDCNKIDIPVVSKSLTESLEVTVNKLTVDQIARGKKLVEADSKGKCVTCHSASVDMLPKDFRFIPSELDKNKAESVAIIRARKDEIAKKIEKRLIETKTMPPMDNDLTDQDRQDVKAYLLSIAVGK